MGFGGEWFIRSASESPKWDEYQPESVKLLIYLLLIYGRVAPFSGEVFKNGLEFRTKATFFLDCLMLFHVC